MMKNSPLVQRNSEDFNMFVEYIISQMCSHNLICADDKDIYKYGLTNGFMVFLNILTLLFISGYFKMIHSAIIFLISFIPLRSYSGGIHCKNRTICYIISTVTIISLLKAQSILIHQVTLFIHCTIICSHFILCKKISTHRNLDCKEQTYYQKNKKKNIYVQIFLASTFLLFRLNEYALLIMSSIMLTSLLLFLDDVKSILYKFLPSLISHYHLF